MGATEQTNDATELGNLNGNKRDEENESLLQEHESDHEADGQVFEKVKEPEQQSMKVTIIWMAVNIIATVLIVRTPH